MCLCPYFAEPAAQPLNPSGKMRTLLFLVLPYLQLYFVSNCSLWNFWSVEVRVCTFDVFKLVVMYDVIIIYSQLGICAVFYLSVFVKCHIVHCFNSAVYVVIGFVFLG